MRLVVAIAGFAVLASGSQHRIVRAADPEAVWLGTEFRVFRQAGLLALQRGDYRTAIREYIAGAEAARRSGDLVSRARFLANLSAAHLLQFDNRTAIQALLAARADSAAARDLATLQAVEANLANLYIQTGDPEAAAAAAIRGAALQPREQKLEPRITILLSFGRAIARTRGLAAAEPTFREAYREAGKLESPAQEAEVLELWGNEASEYDALPEAEDLLARAWVKRKLAKDPRIHLTEGKLGRLARKLGRFETARMWMDRVRAAMAAGQKIPLPEWLLATEQGNVYAGEGRLREALGAYREAVEWARRWRANLPPAERLRLGAERRLQELFDGYLRTAGRLYQQKPDPALSAEMFSLLQTTRAWSMEKNQEGAQGNEALYALARRLEGRWLGGDGAAAQELRRVRATILEKEAAAGASPEAAPVSRLEAPAEGEALLTFWLDDSGSWLWVWTPRGLRVTALPPRQQILREAEAFRLAVAGNKENQRDSGDRLMASLLGDLREDCLRAKRWDIVADDGLFGVPFAALPAGNGAFLIERVELRLVPNALRRHPGSAPPRRFLAVADPIFNSADERRGVEWFWQRPVQAGGAVLELLHLPGTRREAVADAGLHSAATGDLSRQPSPRHEAEAGSNLQSAAGRQLPLQPGPRRDPEAGSTEEQRGAEWFWQRRVHAGGAALELPRLPGTRREAEAARSIWQKAGYQTALHLGAESGEEAVLARLGQWQPGIVHFATHTVTPANELARPRLALSLRSDGTPGVLTSEDISALALRAELVVMSACRSAGAESARGSGLLGLTRAWLTGGARQVMATLWPVGDESTAFFGEFYGRLAAESGESGQPAASALRQAQLACLRGGGPYAEPRYWAGHVLLARR